MTRYVLTRLEYDLCWDQLQLGTHPTVLTINGHGHTTDERRELLHGAWRSLAAKGLVNRTELDGGLERVFRLLARPEREVDARLRLDQHGPRVRALGAARGRFAAVAVLTKENLTLETVDESTLASSVVGLLPPHQSPRSRSISIPSDLLDKAAAAAGESAARMETVLRDGGMTWPDAQKVGSVLGNVVRMGQFGAAVRQAGNGAPGPRKRGQYVVSFYDTPEGRWQFTRRPSGDGRAWSTLAPADHQRLTQALTELLAHTAAPR
ncbi:ESX secretion-associated protein EspG [Umezawaea beigongshangensis]|uniref:ESX secretion-associated protein EspG n=1 Tax=Umezawaea beigongshangensis TaxID=2780383 RepID=UPI0018F21170|nr:ESX secretion-associated protein EspG [Umezawaea beigongshangensis]